MPLFNGRILVTGATGIVGTPIALEIAKAGFSVRATSRSKQRADDWSKKYPEANVEWVIIKDQKDLGVYDEAVKGCDAICHVVGPFILDHKIGEDVMLPAKNGTISILEAAVKEPKVKRIVLTSSVAAITDDPHLGTGHGRTYTEKDWNPTTWEKGIGIGGTHQVNTSYCSGKTIAEKFAWDFVEEKKPHFDLVTLCPATAYGPLTQVLNTVGDLDVASSRLYHYITHAFEPISANMCPIFTNPLDTAEAHLKALTWPKASGQRYQVVSGVYSYERIFAILKKAFPEQAHRFPDIPNDGLPIIPVLDADCSKAENELSMRWRSLEESVIAEAAVLFRLEAESKA